MGDITYIPTKEGWLYLSVFIDLYSRSLVGWSMDKRMKATLVTDSLQMAIWKRKPNKGLMVHSDRSSQYVSDSYQQLLRDNAVAASFFHILKTELVHHENFKTRAEAKQAIFEYIEVLYNRKRMHSSNGYLSPFEYESTLLKAA